MKPKTLTQTYNSGVANIYATSMISASKKVLSTLKISPLPYDERTVGMSRFWAASQEHTKIERLLRFPRMDFVERADIVVANDKQYEIMQIQYPPDVSPPSMDLSLQKVEVAYENN